LCPSVDKPREELEKIRVLKARSLIDWAVQLECGKEIRDNVWWGNVL
jgi:hypothetical protein